MRQIERENLVTEQSKLEYKIFRAVDVLDNIRTPGWINRENPHALGLRLTGLDTDFKAGRYGNKFENMVRVGRIVERLNSQLPQNQQRLIELNSQIQSLEKEALPTATPSGPIPYEPTSLTPKIPAIEKRDLQVYERIKSYLHEVEDRRLSFPIITSGLSKNIGRISESKIKREVARGYSVPGGNRDHPTHDLEDTLVLMYATDPDNPIRDGLSPRLIKEYRRIARNEIAKWEAEKRKTGS